MLGSAPTDDGADDDGANSSEDDADASADDGSSDGNGEDDGESSEGATAVDDGDESDGDGGTVVPGCGNDVVDTGEICFSAPVAIDTPVSGGDVAIADFDGDDRLDVVISDTGLGGPGSPRILLGDGNGSFGAPALAMAPDQPIGPIAVGAIADGAVDLVASSWSTAYLWRGFGDGTLGPVAAIGSSLADLELADLDGNGRLDLVTIDTLGQGIFVHVADVDEDFPVMTLATNNGASIADRVVESGDLDGDGVVDLLTGGSSGIAVFRGLGGGAFAEPMLLEPFEPVGSVAIGDFDGDGIGDAAAGYAHAVRVRLEGGMGELVEVPTQGWVSALAAPDLDDDGLADLVILNWDGSVAIARNEGAAFPVLQVIALPDDGLQVGLALGDLDEDGALDIVTAGTEGGAAHVLLSNP
jgi:hypothetical protein